MRPHVVAWLDRFFSHEVSLLIAPTWFTAIGLAGLVTLLLMMRRARKHGLDGGLIAGAILWSYLAALVAGIVVPMMIDAAEQYVARGQVRVRWAGMTSFWGYLAGGAALVVVCRRGGLAVGRLGDLAAAPLGVALVIARLGCFLAGCDFGKVTSLPWAMRFPSGSPAWRAHVHDGLVPPERTQSLPVHPTQLYEAALGIVMAIVAIWVSRRPWARARPGTTFLAMAATYAIGRIGIEELRGDLGRGFTFGLSSGQLFSVALLAAIGLGVAATWRRARRAAPTAALAIAAAVIALSAPLVAEAQPAPAEPTPAPVPAEPTPAPVPAEPTPAPVPAEPTPAEPTPAPPVSPYPDAATAAPPAAVTGGPGAAPSMAAPRPPPPPPPAGATAPRRRPTHLFEAGVLIGGATALNRREGQVPPLAGPTLSIGVRIPRGFVAWLDLDSFGNSDASHGTVLVSAGMMFRVRPKVELGFRTGLGTTLVNFDEPAFRDVAGATFRNELLLTSDLGDRWFLSFRPLSIDLLSNENLGGPILTWQIRAGLAFRFGPERGRSAAPPPGPRAASR